LSIVIAKYLVITICIVSYLIYIILIRLQQEVLI